MDITLIRHAETTPTPWKNGMGVGRNIAMWSRQAAGEFDVLIATAEMSGTVPFSSYPGVDRSLLVTAGRLLLKSTHRETVLSKDSEPLVFAGEEKIIGTAIGGERVQDFNVLSKRGVVHHTLARWEVPALGREISASGSLLVHIQEGQAKVLCEAFEAQLHTGDTVIINELSGQTCSVKSIGHAICIVGDIEYL
ncbi:HutD family protein [Shinella sp. M27]|uniref:HutD/Ves family protein n=1 Tax=Shinella sp. M27 TaxID=3368614 RepID=UPI003B9FA046